MKTVTQILVEDANWEVDFLKSIFAQSCLLMTRALILAGPPCARPNSMLH